MIRPPFIQKILSSIMHAIGKQLKIKGKSFTVIGVQKEQGESFGAGDSFDRRISIPYNSFRKIFEQLQRIWSRKKIIWPKWF